MEILIQVHAWDLSFFIWVVNTLLRLQVIASMLPLSARLAHVFHFMPTSAHTLTSCLVHRMCKYMIAVNAPKCVAMHMRGI